MAETTGPTTPRPLLGEVSASFKTLLDFLVREGPRVAFFQALALIERTLRSAPRIGFDGPVGREPVRIRPSIALSCPPSDLEGIEATQRGVQITTTFLGLYGVDSPLPYDYSEHLAGIAAERPGERVRSFLDIFHHRLYSLLFRVWKKSRPIGAEPGSVDPLHDRVLSLLGHSEALGLGGQRRPRLREARLRVMRARTTAGLETLLRQRVDPPCTVEQLEHRWAAVPEAQRSRLGRHNSALGHGLLVGARVPDRNKLCLKFPARTFDEFEALLPEGAARREVDDVIAGYLRDPLDYVLDITLAAETVPAWRIGKRGPLGHLGRTAWIGTPRPFARVRWEAWRTPLGSTERPARPAEPS